MTTTETSGLDPLDPHAIAELIDAARAFAQSDAPEDDGLCRHAEENMHRLFDFFYGPAIAAGVSYLMAFGEGLRCARIAMLLASVGLGSLKNLDPLLVGEGFAGRHLQRTREGWLLGYRFGLEHFEQNPP